jgi:hypothetical protein
MPYTIRALPATVVLFHRRPMSIVPPHDTHGEKLADSLSLIEQFIDIRTHIKRYFKIS